MEPPDLTYQYRSILWKINELLKKMTNKIEKRKKMFFFKFILDLLNFYLRENFKR